MKLLAAPLVVLASCQGPDRWSTSVARGEGTAGSSKVDFDTEETTLEIGISGPIGRPATVSRYTPPPPVCPEPATIQEVPVQETDWVTLAGAIGTAVAAALAAVKYIPSDKFKGPWDKKESA